MLKETKITEFERNCKISEYWKELNDIRVLRVNV